MSLPIPVTNDNSRRIIGESAPMQAVLRQVAQVAPTKATVLITGETGVGKDVIAQAIHESSPRKTRLFKAVNCGTFYQDLLQSELFGHEKGSFTGATSQRRGVFEQADGGTLFLDEVGEMSPEVQIPPLRDRREDIPFFVSAFISELSTEHSKPITGITQEALNYLQNADWHGNVRELRNAVETAIILSATEELQLKDFPLDSESKQLVSLLPVQASSTQLAPTQVIDTASEETELLNLPGGALQVVDTSGSAIVTENIAIYKTILGLILSAIRLLDPAAAASNEMPFLIPDEDTSWMQISETDDAADVLKKALEVISTIAKVLENRAQNGILPIAAPVEQHGGSQVPGEYLPVLDDEQVIGMVGMTMAEIEQAAIQKTLVEVGGNKTEAAKILDIGVRTLHRKLDAYRQETDDSDDNLGQA
ncbi:Nitrogen fixation protein AnfA [Geodia barretti]|uniref:Nitrogen fixation protein AnfA n=1 Tax=Geodia barretti TaxID=519541 RepID=A0AA35SGU3_GEOBA|nr:Nitrogen fixation protein AnfA [Geodia barretti]